MRLILQAAMDMAGWSQHEPRMDGEVSQTKEPATGNTQRLTRVAKTSAANRSRRVAQPAPEMALPPELGDAVGFRLRQAISIADRLFAEAFSEMEINTAQYALLMVVRHNPGCQTSAAGSLLGITSNNLVPLLDYLVARGYMRRTLSTADRRVRRLRLTPQGEELCLVLIDRHESLQSRVESRLGKDGAAELLQLLTRYAG